MLTGYRNEEVPFYANPRHTKAIMKEKYATKNVFSDMPEEDAETDLLAAFNDVQHINFTGLSIDVDDPIKLKTAINQNMALIKEVFIHLQGKSVRYPYLDHPTVLNHLIARLDLPMRPIDTATYDTILSSADHSSGLIEGNPQKLFCRATFIEILIRIAKYLYCDFTHEIKNEEGDEYKYVNLRQGFKLFIADKLQPFFLNEDIDRSTFKEEKLMDPEVSIVFSLNIEAIQRIHKKYCRREENEHGQKILKNYMTQADCERLVR